MKNKDLLNMFFKNHLIEEMIKQMFEIQEQILNSKEITFENQLIMTGTAFEFSRIINDFPEIFTKYENKAEENWDKWNKKNDEFAEAQLRADFININ